MARIESRAFNTAQIGNYEKAKKDIDEPILGGG